MNLKDAGIYDLVNIFKGEATIAHNASRGGIINSTPRVINIPAYQRPYRWSTESAVTLVADSYGAFVNKVSEYITAIFLRPTSYPAKSTKIIGIISSLI